MMSLPRLLAILLTLQLLAGCASADLSPSPTTTTNSTASLAPSLTPSPTHGPTVTPRPIVTRSPSPAPSFLAGRDGSDQFWNVIYNYCFFGAFRIPSSLAEMVDASEVVMRGPIVDIRVVWEEDASPSSDDIPRSHLAVKPLEILAGSPELDADGNVRVTFGRTDDVSELRSRLPGHDNLWFLKGKNVYYFADYAQLSLLRNIGGKVRVIRPRAIANPSQSATIRCHWRARTSRI